MDTASLTKNYAQKRILMAIPQLIGDGTMNAFINLRISAKIAVVASFMALVSLGITLFAIDTMRAYNAFNDATVSASRRSTSAEKVNGLINAVVMDSRGVYMSMSIPEATRYGNGILASLKLLEAEMSKWAAAVKAEQRETFAKAQAETKRFVEFRTELARLGREESPAKGREFGDNDANRSNRQQLNVFIQQVAAADLRVRIPMAAGVDSLNVATAAAVAFHEVTRSVG